MSLSSYALSGSIVPPHAYPGLETISVIEFSLAATMQFPIKMYNHETVKLSSSQGSIRPRATTKHRCDDERGATLA